MSLFVTMRAETSINSFLAFVGGLFRMGNFALDLL